MYVYIATRGKTRQEIGEAMRVVRDICGRSLFVFKPLGKNSNVTIQLQGEQGQSTEEMLVLRTMVMEQLRVFKITCSFAKGVTHPKPGKNGRNGRPRRIRPRKRK